MSKPTRYGMVFTPPYDSTIDEQPDGEYVRHDDHDALRGLAEAVVQEYRKWKDPNYHRVYKMERMLDAIEKLAEYLK